MDIIFELLFLKSGYFTKVIDDWKGGFSTKFSKNKILKPNFENILNSNLFIYVLSLYYLIY